MSQAIVTGGAGDIGLAIASRLAEDGYRVGILDLSQDAVDKAAHAIEGAVPLAADVTDQASVEAALDGFGQAPTLVVNNAGIGRFGPLTDLSLADFQAVLQVNLVGAFIVAQAAAKRMMAAGGGSIVNITSIGAIAAAPLGGAYGAAKAGLAKLTEQMAQEWGPEGIRVNAVAPGFIDAGLSSQFLANPGVRALREGAVPTRRLGEGRDVADAVAFLGSESASYINGQQIVVDGGVVVSLLSQLPREPRKDA